MEVEIYRIVGTGVAEQLERSAIMSSGIRVQSAIDWAIRMVTEGRMTQAEVVDFARRQHGVAIVAWPDIPATDIFTARMVVSATSDATGAEKTALLATLPGNVDVLWNDEDGAAASGYTTAARPAALTLPQMLTAAKATVDAIRADEVQKRLLASLVDASRDANGVPTLTRQFFLDQLESNPTVKAQLIADGYWLEAGA